ncbi:MAG: LPXTG cell wall anchor domain-containing protein [Clostridia bacterium]|nr:LPXTG cell wall anchor domain-containing protein [Clostridia bacterium]
MNVLAIPEITSTPIIEVTAKVTVAPAPSEPAAEQKNWVPYAVGISIGLLLLLLFFLKRRKRWQRSQNAGISKLQSLHHQVIS